MAWSFGHWLILIVALVAGVAGGWFLRGRQDAAAAAQASPTMDGDPVAGVTAVMVDAPPAATLDEARPEATVDPTPDAVADRAPVPPGADTRPGADPTPPLASQATVVASDAPRADVVDPTDMVLTGDPVPAPDTVPLDTTTDTPVGHEVVLPAAAEVTGPVDRRPTQPSTPDTEPTAEPLTTPALTPTPAEPEPVLAAAPVAAAAAEPEPVAAAAAEPDRVADTQAEPIAGTVDASAKVGDTPVEPESTPATAPAEPVVVPAPRDELPTPTPADSDVADDFRRIQGVGPKMAAALQAAGIRTYRQLAELDEAALRETIRAAGLRGAPSLATWPQQAKVLTGAPQEAATALPNPAGGTDA